MVKPWPDQPDRFRRPCFAFSETTVYGVLYTSPILAITHLSTHHVIVTRVSLIPDRFFPSLVTRLTFFLFYIQEKVSLVHETTFFPGFFDDQTKTEKALQKALE